MKLVEGALLAADLGAKVINYSWASKIPNPLEEEMCRILEEKGVLLVCSAGNEDNEFPWYPAAYGTALSVGSTDALDRRVPELCGFGDYIDIAAPGVFLKSCWKNSDDDYVSPGFGNSYATAFVSGAAALLLSEDPSLSPAELRALLVSSGAPTTGFGEHPVPRLDIAAAFDKLHGLSIDAPQLGMLTQSGLLELQPLVIGEADWLSVSAHGIELARAEDTPASVTLDTALLPDGAHELVIRAGNASGTAQCSLPVVIDNRLDGLAEFAEDFDSGLMMLSPLNASGYSDELLSGLRQFSPPGWTLSALRGNHSRLWQARPGNGSGQSKVAATQVAGAFGYGIWESALLVSRRLDLGDSALPGIGFDAYINLEEGHDFLRCLATNDNGQSFSQLTLAGAELTAALSGKLPAQSYELDLTPFSGGVVQLVLLLESDGAGIGTDGENPGVWIDSLRLLEDGQPAKPTIGQLALQGWQTVHGPELLVTLPHASGTDSILHELDRAPFGNHGPEDLQLEGSTAADDYRAAFGLASLGNRLALLRITPLSGSSAGAIREVPLWLFSRPGDANADGQVNQADLDFIRTRVGMSADDPDWTVFADSDLDGLITEADAAAVGYNWDGGS